jgi:hypothetical protein
MKAQSKKPFSHKKTARLRKSMDNLNAGKGIATARGIYGEAKLPRRLEAAH